MLRCAQHDSQDSGQGSPSPLTGEVLSPNVYLRTGLRKSLFPLPLPTPKRVKERGAGSALPRRTGTTLLIHLGWGLAVNQSDI